MRCLSPMRTAMKFAACRSTCCINLCVVAATIRNDDDAAPLALRSNGRIRMSIDTRENGNLIGSDKVEGTAVYGGNAEKIGTIERVMIDKMSGRVSYAVLGFGGFLGIGNDHYPLPWQSLKYDTRLGGYVTGVTEDQLRGAPKYGNDNDWNWGDPARNRAVNDYYGVPLV